MSETMVFIPAVTVFSCLEGLDFDSSLFICSEILYLFCDGPSRSATRRRNTVIPQMTVC